MKAKTYCITLIIGFILSSGVSNAGDLVPMGDVKLLDELIVDSAVEEEGSHWGRERRERGRRERRERRGRERRERRERREGWSRERHWHRS